MDHPLPKLPFLLGNVAVAVLRPVLDELVKSSLPRNHWAIHCPLEANAVELIDAILR